MDELFRFNVVRPPNGVTVGGVPLDYGLPQSRYPKKSFLGAMKAAIDAAGGGGRPGLTRKASARMAADAVNDVFSTQQALSSEPLLSTLIEFRQKALEVCTTLAGANPDVEHAGVQLAAKELASMSGTSAYQASLPRERPSCQRCWSSWSTASWFNSCGPCRWGRPSVRCPRL